MSGNGVQFTISWFGLILYTIGIVLAHGFWSTFFALFFPPWGFYLLAERIVEKFL